jgi:flagellar protein FliO/FliZ
MDFILQTLYILLAFGSVLFLAVITTKYLGRKSKKAAKGQYISIIETISLGMDKQIHLMKVGDEFVLVATAGKSINYLTTIKLDASEVEEKTAKNEGNFEFKGFLEKYIQGLKKKTEKKKEEPEISSMDTVKSSGGDVFKSNLSRLRSLSENKIDKQNSEGRGLDTNDK